jgi:hypothetical protein
MLKGASWLEAPKAGFPGITEVELREVHSLLLTVIGLSRDRNTLPPGRSAPVSAAPGSERGP